MDYQFEPVNHENFVGYQRFTFPKYQNAFRDPVVNDGYFGIGVLAGGEPAGLILGLQDGQFPENIMILSVLVITEQRRKDLATTLFKQFETEAKIRGYKGLGIQYIDNRESIQYIERILARLGWNPPQVSDYFYKCQIDNVKHDWLNSFQFSRPFSYCNLTELTAAEKAYLRKGCGVWYPGGLNPFAEEDQIIPELTLFLKHQEEIIGWCSTFQASSQTLAYRSVFVKEKFQGTGMILFLLLKVLRIQLEAKDRFPYAAFQVAVTNKVMEKTVTKITKEFISITKMSVSYKFI